MRALWRKQSWAKRGIAATLCLAFVASGLPSSPAVTAAPVGQGFNLNASDLRFILKQINIAERHAATTTSETGPCGALFGPDADQIPPGGVGVTLPWGLRTVSGICNNIVADQSSWGMADVNFPRLTPKVLTDAEPFDPDGPGGAPATPTSYTQTTGVVADSEPRTISNLIVDQTGTNPAAVAAAGEDPEVTPSGAFFIPNVATDVGLSAPYNSWFTLFGQFFDHGLDLVGKGGNGAVFVPLQEDDPLYDPGSQTNFMILTRATHEGDHEANNSTSPFVDQSQTYTSHPSHQVFLRKYELNIDGDPVATGELITGPGGGMADWAAVKLQAETILGITLQDSDVFNVPSLLTDDYGRFVRGPNGFPQIVTSTGLVEGDNLAPVTTADAVPTGHAFLDDIAHHAVPGVWDDDANPGTPSVPQAPDGDPGTADDNDPGTYDDEMLAAHFIAGDGRVNENIGLTAVHHIFHAEHNRLTEVINGMITDPLLFTQAEMDAWTRTDGLAGWDKGERLFQAARFVTEMEYQHLAFEEFIRKVQPMVNLFGEGGTGYHTEINPAIPAEFAHAVYRFGHSMLTESVDRTRANGTSYNISLLNAFLNPPAFFQGSPDPEVAAGDIIRGMSRQVGNELDEFVTEALRNELLGLPLDLATLNMARARDTGIAGLQAARREFYRETQNPALVPYTSWVDLGFNLKHPESLVNFIAAYGTHPSVQAETTIDGKRAAAQAILDAAMDSDEGVWGPAYAFLNSTEYAGRAFEAAGPGPDGDFGTDCGLITASPLCIDNTPEITAVPAEDWSNLPNGVTITGVDAIDLWVGGLAEKQMVFGGLLGPTFNHVFELTTESLQDGDRFYYLSRTAGLNLLTQLEGNSFAELIQRNTNMTSLPADSFSRPDHIYAMSAQNPTGPILDDPATVDVLEPLELTRMPDGTVRYAGPLHVVFNGRDATDANYGGPGWDNDKIRSSEGDDTIRGNSGDDDMEGGDGADNLIGGEGDDVMTDLFGDDVLKGGDGDDAMSSGQGFGGDLNQGGRGDDFIIGGNDMTETFGGPGDDIVYAGDGEDTVFGDDGDDWIEGGKGPFNLLQGDNGAPFQDDPNEPGHDVLDGEGGETDFDSEGGDDIMMMGPAIQRAEGMLGFDWGIHKGDPQPGDSDMEITGLLPPTVDVNRDRFDLTEAVSGWTFDDILRGDNRLAADMEGHELNAAGIARIAGLSAVLPAGATSFTGGNIILGGDGSDLMEGRGGDDIIDGDAWLNVQLSAPDPDIPGQLKYVDQIAGFKNDVFARRIDPGEIDIVRTVLPGSPGTAVDTALFSGARAEYTITPLANGVSVNHTGGLAIDGNDTVRNVERLQFTDQTVTVGAPAAPTIGTATAGLLSATVNWTAPVGDFIPPIDSYSIDVRTGTTVIATITDVPANATSRVVPNLTAGTAYNFVVYAVNEDAIAGAPSLPSNEVVPFAVAPVTVTPLSPLNGATGVNRGSSIFATFSVNVTGVSVGTNNLANPIGSTNVRLYRGAVTDANRIRVTVSFSPASFGNPATVTINPLPTLLPVGTYTVVITGGSCTPVPEGIRAATGPCNALATTQWSFSTTGVAGPPDTTAPTVTARTPAPNAINVARGANITATFSEAMNATSMTAANVTLVRVSNGDAIPFVVTYNATARRIVINPSVNLRRATTFTVTLNPAGTPAATAIRDTAGNPLATTSWSFTTAA